MDCSSLVSYVRSSVMSVCPRRPVLSCGAGRRRSHAPRVPASPRLGVQTRMHVVSSRRFGSGAAGGPGGVVSPPGSPPPRPAARACDDAGRVRPDLHTARRTRHEQASAKPGRRGGRVSGGPGHAGVLRGRVRGRPVSSRWRRRRGAASATTSPSSRGSSARGGITAPSSPSSPIWTIDGRTAGPQCHRRSDG